MNGTRSLRWRTALLSLLGVGSLASCGQNTPAPVISPPTAQVELDEKLGAQASTNGLTGVYYNNVDFTGTTVTQVDATINKSWGTAKPVTGIDPTTYSVRWTGQLRPTVTQAYTFFLTSSGRARLIVNGELLVNDWTDHAATTTQSVIQLKAGQAYDLRLEYARPTSRAANIKLEWTAPTQSRQVVPNTALLAQGSNAAVASQRLAQWPAYAATGAALDANATSAMVLDAATIFTATERASSNFIIGVLNADRIQAFYRFYGADTALQATDLLTGRTVDLGDYKQYINPDGTTNDGKRAQLITNLLVLTNDHRIETTSAGLTSQGISATICQGTAFSPALLAPVPACPQCQDKANTYRNDICSLTGPVADAVITYLLIKSGKLAALPAVGFFFGLSASDYAAFLNALKNARLDWQIYLDCIAGRLPNVAPCPPRLDPVPAGLATKAKPGQMGVLSTAFGNSTSSSSVLQYRWAWTASTAGLRTSVPTDVTQLLKPGQRVNVDVRYDCAVTPTVLVGELTLYTNDPEHHVVPVPIRIECQEYQPKLQAPDQLTISAPVDQTASGSFEISNVGDPDSVLNYTLTPNGGLSVSPTNGALAQGQTSSLTVSAPCTTAGTSNALLLVESNDPGKSQHTIPVSVKCLGENWIGHVSFTFNTGYSRTVDNYEEGLCEASAYAWYRNDGNLYSQLGMQNMIFRGMEKIMWSGYWWSVNCDQYGYQALNSKEGLYTASLNELIDSWKQNNDPSIDDSKVTFRSMPYIIQEPSFPGNGTSSGSFGWNIYASY